MKRVTLADIACSVIGWEDMARQAKKNPHSLFTESYCDNTADAARKLLKQRLDSLPAKDQPNILNIVQLEERLR